MIASAKFASRAKPIPGWLPAVLLIAVTALIGPRLGGAARPLFLLGSLLAGRYAWADSPGAHLQATLALFSFAPFLRRVVDYSAGFDPSGAMIAGPLLALLAPLPELRQLTLPGTVSDRRLVPFLVFGACVAYATTLTLLEGDLAAALAGMLKWGTPLIYAIAIFRRAPDGPELVRDAAAAFTVILAITGIYGIYQYIDPPVWDCYWLIQASITSAGLPFPYEVRVFSTMNAPAAFATYTAAGLLLVYFLRPGWLSRIAIIPAFFALTLSLFRTAWISLAVSVVFCLLLSRTRARGGTAFVLLCAGIIIALVLTPFGDVIAERLSTFGEGSHDDSGQERLAEFDTLWNQADSQLFGVGFITSDIRTAGAAPTDGLIALCWKNMGIVAGLVCIASVVSVIFSAILASIRSREPEAIIAGALSCGWFVQIPLATITTGELGFLFWATATWALCMPKAGARA